MGALASSFPALSHSVRATSLTPARKVVSVAKSTSSPGSTRLTHRKSFWGFNFQPIRRGSRLNARAVDANETNCPTQSLRYKGPARGPRESMARAERLAARAGVGASIAAPWQLGARGRRGTRRSRSARGFTQDANAAQSGVRSFAAVDAHVYALSSPDRIVVDLPEVNFQLDPSVGRVGVAATQPRCQGVSFRPACAGQIPHRHRPCATGLSEPRSNRSRSSTARRRRGLTSS